MSYLEQYCRAVINGKITACRKIERVCQMLMDDLLSPGEWHFDEDEANRHIEFIERFCKIPSGKLGAPFKLDLFQKAQLQAAFGFVDDNGIRKYNEVLIIEGRKNGKSSLLAAIMIDMLLNDGEGSPQIVSAATALDQAKLSFNAALKMVRQSPMLSKHIKKRAADLYFDGNMGTIRALANNTNSLDGLDLHCCVIDELSAIKNRDTYDLLKQAMGARTQPILWCITTNGFLREGIFDAQYQYAADVLDGKIDNPRFLPFIYELDSLKEWEDETCWQKANPGLGTIKSLDYLRQMVAKGKADLSFRPTVMVKDFNMKQTGESAWLRWEDFANDDTFELSAFDYGIGGFDAADTLDLNAATALFVRADDPHIYRASMYWIPEEQLNHSAETGLRMERDQMPYEKWIQRGLMRSVPGNRVPHSVFLEWFRELRDEHDIYTMYIGYDPWHIDEELLGQFRAEFGAKSMIPIRQGVWTLSEPMKNLKAELVAGNVVYNANPIDRMCFMNTEIKADINGNIQPVKGLNKNKRIDGTVAMLCAYKVLQDHRQELEGLNG